MATRESPSRKEPRGFWVSTNHKLSRIPGVGFEVEVEAPTWCQPCDSEPMELRVAGASRFFVTTPPELWSRQKFVVYLLDNFNGVRGQVVTPAVTQEEEVEGGGGDVGDVRAAVVAPPRRSGRKSILVLLPFGYIRSVEVPKALRYSGGTFEFKYNLEEEKRAQLQEQLNRQNRCCCRNGWGCFWFPLVMLKETGSCPRVEVREGQTMCAKDHCGAFGSKNCRKTHHGKGKCEVSEDTRYHFAGGRCPDFRKDTYEQTFFNLLSN